MIEKMKTSAAGRGVGSDAEAREKLLKMGISPDVIAKIQAVAAEKMG